MKIYFEDGALKQDHQSASIDYLYTIDASNGYTHCKSMLEYVKNSYPNCIIYTNSIIALNNKYCWNRIENIPELYLRDTKTGRFIRVDSLTDKEIREPHNLMLMYMNGAFKNCTERKG